jgi:hypothetical protein
MRRLNSPGSLVGLSDLTTVRVPVSRVLVIVQTTFSPVETLTCSEALSVPTEVPSSQEIDFW